MPLILQTNFVAVLKIKNENFFTWNYLQVIHSLSTTTILFAIININDHKNRKLYSWITNNYQNSPIKITQLVLRYLISLRKLFQNKMTVILNCMCVFLNFEQEEFVERPRVASPITFLMNVKRQVEVR